MVAAIGAAPASILVAQSMAAYTAPLVCARVAVELLLLVAPMIPAPGESPGACWYATGQTAARRELRRGEGRDPDADFDLLTTFLHDTRRDVVDASSPAASRRQSGTPFGDPWPLTAWPDVPTRVLLGRHDRLLPLGFGGRSRVERLGVESDVIDSGHLPALAAPGPLADWLVAAAT